MHIPHMCQAQYTYKVSFSFYNNPGKSGISHLTENQA